MKEILHNLEWRYAVKKFDSDQMLSEKQLDLLQKAFNLTATSYGLQPIKLVVLSNKEIQEQLVPFSFDQRQVAQASHVLIFCIEKNIDSNYISSYFKRVQEIRGTSNEILEPYREALLEDFKNRNSNEILDWAKNQAYLAMGNLLTICALQQIDSCPMEGFDPAGYNRLLGLDAQGLSAVLVLPVGHRAADDMFSGFKKVRRDLKKSVIHIT